MERTLANIEIEIYEKDGNEYVFMSTDGSSGVKEPIDSLNNLGNIVAEYVKQTYLENA